MSLVDNLVAYYKLDESSGNAVDSVGSNTLTNNGTATYTTGKINNALTLNGSSQYLSTTTIPSISGAMTINAWVKTSINNASQIIFGAAAYVNVSNYSTLEFRLTNSAKIQFTEGEQPGSKGDSLIGSTNHPTNEWFMATITIDSSRNAVLYYNGSSDATKTLSSRATRTKTGAYAGAIDYFGSVQLYLTGQEDEIGIWSRALSSTEVTELYNSGNGKYPFSIQVLISEALALVESITNLRGLKSTISETLSLSETWTALKGILFTISETITTSEVWTTARVLVSTVIDTLGLSELITFKNKWTNQTKNTSTWTNSTKNTSSWTNENKN